MAGKDEEARPLEVSQRIFQLAQQEYHCSQILMILGLELQGKCDWDLVRTVDGLKGGLGFSGKLCGALTGAVCLLGLYAGRGPLEEKSDFSLTLMTQELVDWFEGTYGGKYGGIDCEQILSGVGREGKSATCKSLVLECYHRAIGLLEANGFDPRLGRGEKPD